MATGRQKCESRWCNESQEDRRILAEAAGQQRALAPQRARPYPPAAADERGTKTKILDKLVLLFGEERSGHCFSEVERLMQAHYARKPVEMIKYERTFNPADRFTEKDVIAITMRTPFTIPNNTTSNPVPLF